MAGFFFVRKPVPTTQKITATPTPVSPTTVREGREIEVSADEYSFSPGAISVKKGEKIRLTFKNTGKLPHNYTIDELGVATKTIGGGQTETIEFTAEKSGTFTYYCGVGNHRSLGMEGKLEVR